MAIMLDGMVVYGLAIKVGLYQAKTTVPTITQPSSPTLVPPGTTPEVQSTQPQQGSNEERLKRTVYVASCMLEEMTEDEVGAHFGHCGRVLACKKKGKYAWIEFEKLEAAQVAMSLDGETIGNRVLKVMPSRTPILRPSAYKQYPVALPAGQRFQHVQAYPYAYPMYPYHLHGYPYPVNFVGNHTDSGENGSQNVCNRIDSRENGNQNVHTHSSTPRQCKS